VRTRAADEELAKQIILRYQDKRFSFTDAISFVVMERLGIRFAFSFDRNFAQYGFTSLQADRLWPGSDRSGSQNRTAGGCRSAPAPGSKIDHELAVRGSLFTGDAACPAPSGT
jgi:hypothetical protein